MRLHKNLPDDKLEIAFLTVSVFPHSEIVKTLEQESIKLDTGNLEWWQVAQLLKIEMAIRGIVDNRDLQDRYIESRKRLL